jgi:ATP-dependent phosphofructokinase / diphosphate-dependent phosphofructokinase
MEDHFINAAGNDVTKAFYDYLRPLLGPDMIDVARLRGTRVEKAGALSGDVT